MEVPIWFATCRRPTGRASTEAYFGTDRGDNLSLGIIKVSIPDTDNVAQTRQELPYLWWWDRWVVNAAGPLKNDHLGCFYASVDRSQAALSVGSPFP